MAALHPALLGGVVMSLINDVLRDLDRRGAAPPLRAAQPVVPASAPRRRSGRIGPVVGAALALMGTLVGIGWRGGWLLAESPPVAAVAAEPARPGNSSAQASPDEGAEALESAPLGEATSAAVPAKPVDRADALAPPPRVDAPPASTATASPPPPERPASSGAAVAQSTAEPAPSAPQIATTASTASPRIERRTPPVGPAQVALQQAEAAVAAGRHDTAIALLEAVLQQVPDSTAIARRLGRLLLEAGQAQRAVDVLARQPPSLRRDPNYTALLAAAWQQAGQPAQAAAAYQALLQHDPGQAQWWLGLAVAQQSLDQGPQALASFRRARAAGGLTSGVLAYIDQRIEALDAGTR